MFILPILSRGVNMKAFPSSDGELLAIFLFRSNMEKYRKFLPSSDIIPISQLLQYLQALNSQGL